MTDTEGQLLRRRQVVDAEHNGRMEGLEISAAARKSADLFINGEIDAEGLVAQIRSRYGHA